MTTQLVGQLSLMAAMLACALSTLSTLAAGTEKGARPRLSTVLAGVAMGFLCLALGVLVRALLQRDFSFAYVARYTSLEMSWRYALSALWVGQAGSLLLWSWMSVAAALLFAFTARSLPPRMVRISLGILMALACFLVSTIVFAVDPMQPALSMVPDGIGLSPILRHPSMLVHPPVVFLSYACWAVPFALIVGARWCNAELNQWYDHCRAWLLVAWSLAGAGIFLGAHWAYQELGWGGYWAWDPVENGSLLPWLLGTAALHAMLIWRHRGLLPRVASGLVVLAFAACGFATFLTRSGIFSSLHAFSESPIGWAFLGEMVVLASVAVWVMVSKPVAWRRRARWGAICSRESAMAVSLVALVLFAMVVWLGTISSAITPLLFGTTVFVEPAFYNAALVPVAAVVLSMMAIVPLLNWKTAPTQTGRRRLAASAAAALVGVAGGLSGGIGEPVWLGTLGVTCVALVALLCATWQDRASARRGLLHRIGWSSRRRRKIGAYVVHVGLCCSAFGVAGSSLGSQRVELALRRGEHGTWAGRPVRLVGTGAQETPEKLIASAVLELHLRNGRKVRLVPEQRFYRRSEEWTAEAAIVDTWRGDYYAVMHGMDENGKVRLSLIFNPVMRFIWLGGWLMALGATLAGAPALHASRSQCVTEPTSLDAYAHTPKPQRSIRSTVTPEDKGRAA